MLQASVSSSSSSFSSSDCNQLLPVTIQELPETLGRHVGVKALAFVCRRAKAKAFTPTLYRAVSGNTPESLLLPKPIEDDDEDGSVLTVARRP